MIDSKFIDDLVKKLADNIPPGVQAFKNDLERNFRSVLKSAFAKLHLVTREEFDVQKGVLAKTRSKVETLEKQLTQLEAKLLNKSHKKGSKTK